MLVRPRGEPLRRRLIVPSEFETRFDATTLTFPPADDLVERVQPQLAVVVDRDHPELGARAVRDVLPGHEVRVVLELGDEDEVAGAEVVQPPGVRDEVQRSRSRCAAKMISRVEGALTNARTFSRAPS